MGGVEVRLTADLVARAVIAAAQAYGDDPIAALLAPQAASGAKARRCLPVAASALAWEAGCSMRRIAPILGCSADAIYVSRRRSDPTTPFARAESLTRPIVRKAAMEALALEAACASTLPRTVAEPPVHRHQPVGGVLSPGFNRETGPAKTALERERERVRGSLSDRILLALANKPMSAMTLAAVLDAKELVISQTLDQLRLDGEVRAGVIPDEGRRHQCWHFVAGETE